MKGKWIRDRQANVFQDIGPHPGSACQPQCGKIGFAREGGRNYRTDGTGPGLSDLIGKYASSDIGKEGKEKT